MQPKFKRSPWLHVNSNDNGALISISHEKGLITTLSLAVQGRKQNIIAHVNGDSVRANE